MAEIILAIEAIHKANIVYRDLKMENILLTKLGHVKICDFGLSKMVYPGDKTYTVCGTIGYMAPETMLGQGYDHKCDIWALAVILCEMIGGFSPFYNEDPMKMYQGIAAGKINYPMSLTKEPKHLLSTIFVLEPNM